MNFVQIAEFDWVPWQHKGYIFEKNLLLRSRKGDEVETLHYVQDISLYVNYVFFLFFFFFCHCPCAFVAMAT